MRPTSLASPRAVPGTGIHYPWLAGLLLSPLLFGSVNTEGQVIVGLLFAISVAGLATDLGSASLPLVPRPLLGVACFFLLLPCLPLPSGWVEWLSPARARLAAEFPVPGARAPGWISMTLSPVNTVQRLWELSLAFSAFVLARHAAAHPAVPRDLAWVIAAAIFLLGASDVWLRTDDQQRLLGLWPNNAGHAAGTFANRNHFANWIQVGSLFVFGWVLRRLAPLRGSRTVSLPPEPDGKRGALVLGAILLFGLLMAALSGSRTGIVAWLAGVGVWTVLLVKRSRTRRRWLFLAGSALLAFLAVLAASEYLLGRFASAAADLEFKTAIWRDAAGIVLKFPGFGSGWGSFVIASNLYKSFRGENTFLHAENDYLETLVECGLAGVLALGIPLALAARAACRGAATGELPEPELAWGALAGLAAFAVHAVFDFVWQVPATAILAATLAGFLIGATEARRRPLLPPPLGRGRLALNAAWALALGSAAILQAVALARWQAAVRSPDPVEASAHLEASLRAWPWDSNRATAWLRLEARLLAARPDQSQNPPAAQVESIRRRLRGALSRDPLNWSLRLEGAWFELAFGPDPERTRLEAWRAHRLNPLQPAIPLQFARYFAATDPAVALEFLRAAPADSPRHRREVLTLAWQIQPAPAQLWRLTPDTPEGLQALGDFALSRNLFPLAAQAFERLTGKVDPLWLAERLLAARRPLRAIELTAPLPPSSRSRLLLSRALIALRRFPEAIRHAEAVWLESAFRREILSPAAPGSPAAIAEEICRRPPEQRDLARLRGLVQRNPDDLRTLWLLFQTELEQQRFGEAAEAAVQLAGRVVARESPDPRRRLTK